MACLQAVMLPLYAFLLVLAPTHGLLMPNELFPFGDIAGDLKLSNTDDNSSPLLNLEQPVTFFGRERSSLVVNNNGLILFNDDTMRLVSRNAFPNFNAPAIAPFYGDVDTTTSSGPGAVFYRTTTDTNLLSLANEYIRTGFIGFENFQATELVIATWDRVGYYNKNIDKVNTFQAILVSDTRQLFSIFLYKDIQWTTGDSLGGENGLGGSPAQVGFNAGDLVNSFSLPSSQTNSVADIEHTSNIGVAGVWLFLVSPPTIISAGCIPQNPVLRISPDFANMLGGEVITLQGCFHGDQIKCEFDGVQRTATRVSNHKVMCVVPPISRAGRVTLRVTVDTIVTGEVPFTALDMVGAHRVDLDPGSSSLSVSSADTLSLSWSPEAIFPGGHSDAYRVNLVLYELDTTNNIWIERGTLLANTENDGSQEVLLGEPRVQGGPIAPVTIQVMVNRDSINSTSHPQLHSVAMATVGQWTGEFYFSQSDLSSARQYKLCQEWGANQNEPTVSSELPCPARREQALLGNSGLREIPSGSVYGNALYHSQWLDYFHSGAQSCFTERVSGQATSARQECCYDDQGHLLTNSPGGGFSHQIPESLNRGNHFVSSKYPYILCCTGEIPSCPIFYEKFPSDNGQSYNPPSIGWVFGDPHFITFDSTHYTFNGLGEFTLIETADNSLRLQGRFERVDSVTSATILTAVTLKELSSNTVMILISQESLLVFIDGDLVDFSLLRERIYNRLTVIYNGQSVVVVTESGLYLEIRLVDNNRSLAISVVLPSIYENQTRGLLGVYNLDPSDDLVPKQGGTAVSPSAGNENIHNSFGVTWILTNQSESLFHYLPYQSFSSNPSFVPIFEPATPSAELANICANNDFCLYDGLVSGDVAMATSTLATFDEITRMEQISVKPSCSPSCVNGACVSDGSCACSQGYSGVDCSTPQYTVCPVNPCSPGQRCGVLAGSYHCIDSCLSNSQHPICQLQAVGPCADNQCLNGGVCQPNSSIANFGFVCLCQQFFQGVLCGNDNRPVPGPCASNPCQNGGTCSVNPARNDSYTCSCADNFYGNNCSIMIPYLVVVVVSCVAALVVLVGIILIAIVISYYCCKRRSKKGEMVIPITNRPDSVLIKSHRSISTTPSPPEETRPVSAEIPRQTRRLSLSREVPAHSVLQTSPTHDSSTNSLNNQQNSVRDSFSRRDPLAHRNSLPSGLSVQGSNFNGRASINHIPNGGGSSNNMYSGHRQTGTQSQQGFHDYLQKPNVTQYYSMQSVGNMLSQQSLIHQRDSSRRSSYNYRVSTHDSINTQTTDV